MRTYQLEDTVIWKDHIKIDLRETGRGDMNWPEWLRIESLVELCHNSYVFVSSLTGNLFILEIWGYWMRLFACRVYSVG
jgi:hypothetical protein